MRQAKLFRSSFPLLLVAWIFGPAFADVVVQPTIINNTLGEFSSSWSQNFAVDQSGLSIGYVSNVTDFDAYIDSIPQHPGPSTGSYWYSDGTTVGFFDLDLGAPQVITRMAMWNPGNDNSTKMFNIYTSNDPSFSSSTQVGTFESVLSPFAQVIELTDTNARYVRLHLLTNHGGNFQGFGEIAFATTTAVPEPCGIPTLGLAALAIVGLRRRAVTKRRGRFALLSSARRRIPHIPVAHHC